MLGAVKHIWISVMHVFAYGLAHEDIRLVAVSTPVLMLSDLAVKNLS